MARSLFFRRLKKKQGQSTIEYLLMVGFGALLAIQVATFFNDVFKDGLRGLQTNIQRDMATGKGFGN